MAIQYPAGFQRTRWTIFGILVLSYMLVFFHRMVPGAVASDLMAAFGTSAAALGSLAAMYYYIYTAMQIPSGVLADTLGPRISVSLGGLVAGGGSIMLGMAETFDVASVGRFLVGLGVSVIFVGLMRSNAVWFSEREYGKISGLTILLGNVGSILAAAPLVWLLGFFTWREVFIGIGALSIALSLLTWILVRNSPEKAGFSSVREMEGLAPHAPSTVSAWKAFIAVFTNRSAWPGFWVNMGVTGNMFAFVGLWGIPLLRDVHGLSRADASNYTTVSLIGFALGVLLMGWASDRSGYRKPFVVGAAFISTLAWLSLLYLPWAPGWSAYLVFAFLGFSASGFVVGYAAVKEVCVPTSAGMAVALVNTGVFLGAAIMQPLFGWIIDQTWNGVMNGAVRVYAWSDYANALWASVIFAAFALLVSFRVRETNCKNITHD